MIIYIIIGVVVVLLLYVVGVYNKLVKLRNMVKDQWSQIEIVLKRRADLIPNIVETVKGYAKHESETLTAVIDARNKVAAATSPQDEMKASAELNGALGRLFAVSESYPELKANTNFLQLQTQLNETEDKITYSRQFYNDTALKYRNAIETFPTNIIAGMFGFNSNEALFFEADAQDKEVPKVSF